MSTTVVRDTPSSATPRNADLGLWAGVSEQFSQAQTLAMYRQICFNRYFELNVADAIKARSVQVPAYLSVGQEHIPAAIAQVFEQPLIFAQHRAHSYYLSFGGKPESLRDELLGLPTGCAQGKGGSASIHDPSISMYGHSGLMGDQIPIAVGAAIASGKRTLAVAGDASIEEDYAFGAMSYAITKKAPVLFICEDNDFSILTPVATRRSWNMCNVARSLGMLAEDITDDPWLIAHQVRRLAKQLPAYLNIRTCRQLWHAGAGCDGPPEWNRFELIQAELDHLNLRKQRLQIETDAEKATEALWQRYVKPNHP